MTAFICPHRCFRPSLGCAQRLAAVAGGVQNVHKKREQDGKAAARFSNDFDIASAMDKLEWPLTAMVKILTNAKEKALDIDVIVKEEEDKSDD